MVLSREDAGAEQIFRNDGVKLIQKLDLRAEFVGAMINFYFAADIAYVS